MLNVTCQHKLNNILCDKHSCEIVIINKTSNEKEQNKVNQNVNH